MLQMSGAVLGSTCPFLETIFGFYIIKILSSHLLSTQQQVSPPSTPLIYFHSPPLHPTLLQLPLLLLLRSALLPPLFFSVILQAVRSPFLHLLTLYPAFVRYFSSSTRIIYLPHTNKQQLYSDSKNPIGNSMVSVTNRALTSWDLQLKQRGA